MIKYKTIKASGTSELVEKKSRFIANVKPVQTEQEAISFISDIKSKYWDARHNVYAYTVIEGNGIQRYSDDGEPAGTAGIPVLDVMIKEEIKNTVIVITRYFGGILLGTGGLVRAYGSTAKLGLYEAGIIEKVPCVKCELDCSYDMLGKIQNRLISYEAIVEEIQYTDSVKIVFLLEPVYIDNVQQDIDEIAAGKCIIAKLSDEYINKDI